jgi:O-acetyl-ADP-ribose deacetylase (regulator of RNase III)
MVKFIKEGNIFRIVNIKNYAHGCNCAGAMGKGIALTFKEKFPEMYFEYKTLCKNGNFKLGDVFLYQYEDGFIFNLGTQLSWKTYVNYDGLSAALKKMFDIASSHMITPIVLPKIGAGLGGGDWDIIKNTIIKISEEYDKVDLYVIENYKDIELVF